MGELVGVLVQIVLNRENPAELLSAVHWPAQSAANHLHIECWTEDWTRYDDQIGSGRVKSSRQCGVIAENADFSALKRPDEPAPRNAVCVARNSCCADPHD